ncbi:helix-turn-helix domain-containing protein [Anaeromyxobacter dehalogenans]|uniref:helix-turn-helix domain-containing protein n=1 Tax=Anaeromyxobacter dehalogenans TaxID=161493 RepID=UPI0009D76E19
MEPISSSISTLRLLRLTAGLPQFVLAKRANMAASRLSVIERGYDEPTEAEQAQLARALGVPQEALFPDQRPSPIATTPGTKAAHDSERAPR